MKTVDKYHKGIYILGMMTMASAIALIAFFMVIILYPFKPVEVFNAPFPILNKEVKRGDYLEMVVDYCKYGDYSLRVTKSFSDGVFFQGKTSSGRLPSGCHKVVDASEQIPMTLPTGEYELQILVEYDVAPFRTIQKEFYSEKFKVI